jgi:nitrogenase subunit NifH
MLKMFHSFVTKIKELLLMNKGGIGPSSISKMFTTAIVKRSHTIPISGTFF